MSNRRVALGLLLAVNAAGCIEIERDEDDADRAPVARIAVNPTSGPAPLAVSVSGAASTAARGAIASYAWTFGDGTVASGVTAGHTYATVGTYQIALTVADAKGRTGSTTVSVVATGAEAVFDASAFDAAAYQPEAASGTYDATTLQ
jgi:PKD repeat protein